MNGRKPVCHRSINKDRPTRSYELLKDLRLNPRAVWKERHTSRSGRYLGRPADPIGLGDQIEALRQGTTPSVVETSILSGSEYYHRNGSTPEGFVIALYRDVLGASPNGTDVAVLSQRAIVSGRNAVATQVLNMRPTYIAPVTAYSVPPTVVVQPAPITVVRTVPAYRVYVPPPVYYYSPGISVRLRLGR